MTMQKFIVNIKVHPDGSPTTFMTAKRTVLAESVAGVIHRLAEVAAKMQPVDGDADAKS